MRQVKLGFVGAGFMTQLAHLPCFSAIEGCRVVAIASSRPKLRDMVARKFGIPKQYDSWPELAEDPEIDAVAAILPPEFNPDIACALLSAGKHVFIEKPMALSAVQAERMAEAAARAGKLLMVGYMKRYDPAVERAKQFWDDYVAAGKLGKIVSIRAWSMRGGNWTANIERLFPVLRTDEPFAPKPIADLGPNWLPENLRQGMPGFASPYYDFLHVHSHDVNLLRFFMGDDWQVVHADFRHHNRLVHVRFGDVLASFETTSNASVHGFEEGIKFYFEGGWLEVLLPPPLEMQGQAAVRAYIDADKTELRLLGEWDWAFRRQAEHFIQCIRGETQCRSDAADSAGDLRLVEAIFKRAVEDGTI